jgi:hypothetical protein
MYPQKLNLFLHSGAIGYFKDIKRNSRLQIPSAGLFLQNTHLCRSIILFIIFEALSIGKERQKSEKI